jgi:hypothetical protein
VNGEFEKIWKEAVVAYLGVLSRIRPESLSKATNNLSQGSWSSGRDLNQGPPEYEAGLLTTRPLRSMTYITVQ